MDEPSATMNPETKTETKAATKAAIRRVLQESEAGAPAVGSTVRDRFATDEIYRRVVAYGDYELSTETRELVASGVAGGFAIAITFLLYASMTGLTDGTPILSELLYPLGFMYIILGGYQLYTENTLPPVALVLERLASLPALLRVFGLVLLGNVLGAAVGAIILAYTGVFSPEAAQAAVEIGETGVATPWWDLFFKAIFAGLIVAGVVWMDFAAGDTISRLVLIYLAFLAIPLAGLYHVVVSATELMFLAMTTEYSLLVGLWEFLLPVLLGNTLGGILLVTVVNYFQTGKRRLEGVRDPDAEEPLSWAEWFLGPLAGRSYVPPARAIDDATEENGSSEPST